MVQAIQTNYSLSFTPIMRAKLYLQKRIYGVASTPFQSKLLERNMGVHPVIALGSGIFSSQHIALKICSSALEGQFRAHFFEALRGSGPKPNLAESAATLSVEELAMEANRLLSEKGASHGILAPYFHSSISGIQSILADYHDGRARPRGSSKYAPDLNGLLKEKSKAGRRDAIYKECIIRKFSEGFANSAEFSWNVAAAASSVDRELAGGQDYTPEEIIALLLCAKSHKGQRKLVDKFIGMEKKYLVGEKYPETPDAGKPAPYNQKQFLPLQKVARLIKDEFGAMLEVRQIESALAGAVRSHYGFIEHPGGRNFLVLYEAGYIKLFNTDFSPSEGEKGMVSIIGRVRLLLGLNGIPQIAKAKLTMLNSVLTGRFNELLRLNPAPHGFVDGDDGPQALYRIL